MTRAEAMALNAPKYTTGEPCSNGHLCERYTNTAACVLCTRIYARTQRERDVRKMVKIKGNLARKLFKAYVHPDDIPTMEKHATALNLARELDAKIWK